MSGPAFASSSITASRRPKSVRHSEGSHDEVAGETKATLATIADRSYQVLG
jgi:hypothetical protein